MCIIDTEESKLVDKERVITSLDQLQLLKGEECHLCNTKLKFDWSGQGSVRIMKWSCLSGHTGRWVSSEVISTRHHTPVYLNNILLTSSVVVTGNNWLKVHNLFQAINLAIPERNLFQTNQSLFVSPEIKSFWTDMTTVSYTHLTLPTIYSV